MVEIIKQKISEEDDGIRIDRWFQRHYKQYSFAQVSKLARTGQLRIDGKRVKSSERLIHDQEIRFPNVIDDSELIKNNSTPVLNSKKRSEMVDIIVDSVIYIDPHALVINKPAGLAVQGGKGIDVSVDDLSTELQFDAKEKPKLVHRIDKETSGILIMARSTKAAQEIANSFQNRKVEKKYLAILQGIPKHKSGTIDAPLAKMDDGAGFENMGVSDRGMESITKYKVLSHDQNISLVEFEPITGRKHQIRAHAEHIGCPIMGDKKYNSRMSEWPKFKNMLCLHASYIAIEVFGEKIKVEAPIPDYFKSVLDFFKITY